MSDKKPSTDIKQDEKKQPKEKGLREKEIGGFENRREPTRYGDWEVNGRCSDF